MTQKLIVNADDYGLSPLFNKGILDLIEKGIVTSTTVMIKRKYVRPALLTKFEKISIGLHLELKEADTKKEINNQLKLFIKKFKRLPSHVDGHQHKHLTKTNFPKVIEIAKKYSLPIRSYASEDNLILKKNGVSTPDDFISWHPSRTETLFTKLKNTREKIIEFVCHPGYYDKKSSYAYYNKCREKELNFLQSKQFKSLLNKFEKIGYFDIQK